jgi:predicted Co/Zn/Cd cation transporter (cation efflux family)
MSQFVCFNYINFIKRGGREKEEEAFTLKTAATTTVCMCQAHSFPGRNCRRRLSRPTAAESHKYWMSTKGGGENRSLSADVVE